MNNALKRHYIEHRRHQMKIANDGGGAITIYQSGRTELSYASAPYGEHALSAYMAAKRHMHYASEVKINWVKK